MASSSSSLKDRLRRLDAHSSVESEFRVYTAQGAILSVLTLVMILYLVVSEARYHFKVSVKETVHVNATSPRGLELEFDISFWDVPCAHLSIDANDPTGQAQSLHLDAQHHVWKHRVRFSKTTGKRTLLGRKEKLELGSTLLSQDDLMEEAAPKADETKDGKENAASAPEEDSSSYCGSCYGAGEDPDECCNTCDDVERAYKRKGWVLQDLSKIPQCATKHLQKTLKDEGCNVHGKVALSTGGGNLHLAPSKSALQQQQQQLSNNNAGDAQVSLANIMELLMGQVTTWNVSHVIHKLRFGPEFPGAAHQLDEYTKIVADTYGMYQYYLQIVPTTYRYQNGTTIASYQYSVTEHLRHVDYGSSRGLPGVFFFYEVSPLHVLQEEQYAAGGWVAFLTSVCAVVGGTVTVMGLLDQYLFRTAAGRREGLGV